MNRRHLWWPCVLAVATGFAPSAHAQPSVVVRGDATCPSADMILAALPAAASEVDWSGQTITVEVVDDRLALTLGDAGGARREIPADADCAIRAQSVAVVIAAWSGELGALPSDSPMFTVASPPPLLTPAKRPSHLVEVNGAAFYSPVWGHGLGASLDVSRRPWRGHVGARALLAYQSARDVVLEGGTNQILRMLVGATLTYQRQSKRWFAAGDLGLAGTLTLARGSGYEPSETAGATNFGGIAELRGGLRFGRLSVWLNARGLRLVHDETVKVQSTSPGVADSATLNAWDVQLGLGLGYRFERI
jgi:hypothetical protein